MKSADTDGAAGYSPADIAFVLETDDPLFLVGGQAVNVWGLYYHQHTVELGPLVSQDVDVLGNRETLLRIAELTGNRPKFFAMRPPTNEVGVVVASRSDGYQFPVEVLNHVHGITNDELCQPTYTIVVGASRVQVRIPSPVALLQAKIANVNNLAQAERQDERHVRILACLMPAFLDDVQKSAAAGRLNERELLDLLERLVKILSSPNGRATLETFGIRPRSMFAEFPVDPDVLPKIYNFFTIRLPRLLPAD